MRGSWIAVATIFVGNGCLFSCSKVRHAAQPTSQHAYNSSTPSCCATPLPSRLPPPSKRTRGVLQRLQLAHQVRALALQLVPLLLQVDQPLVVPAGRAGRCRADEQGGEKQGRTARRYKAGRQLSRHMPRAAF